MQPGSGKALRRALGYLGAYRRDAVGALAALILVSGANLVAPQLIRIAIDGGVAQRQLNLIVLAVVGLIAVALVRGTFTFAQAFLAERASQKVAYDLRNEMYAQVERLSFSYYDRIQTGQLLTRLTNDVEQIRTFVGTGVIQLVAAVVMLLGSATVLLIINWRLALVALLIIPAILVLLLGFVRKIGPLFGEIQQTLSQLNTVLQEDLSGVRTIRAFAREAYETERYRSVNDALLNTNIRAMRQFSNNFPFVFLLANIGTLAVIWYGGWETIAGRLTVGELIAFNSYLTFLLFPVLTIGFQAAGVARAGTSALRVFEILDAPREVQDKPDAKPLPAITGYVEFRDVHFRYQGSDHEVLRGVNFRIEPGQTVAVLGTTGAGKSTIINLLPRFYDVTGGSVLVDGHDVRDVTLSSLRSQIGIVLQETLLFSGTVRENIAYGKPDAGQAAIEAAARAAQAEPFIRDLPQGYDTIVGERGVGLSGGQRQRIAIARALLVDPKLLILDDSTSAVDAGTEAAIKEALDQLMRAGHRTALVIAQRISTVRDADLILVLNQGKIVAQGTHDELTQTSELYNEILGSQLQRDDELAAAS
jgi:ATP-binding cassette subfamily B protein